MEIKRNHVPYLDEKIKLFNRSRKKLYKISKRKKTKNQLNSYIKNDIVEFLKSNNSIRYINALEFIMFFSTDFIKIKQKVENGKLDPNKIKTSNFWLNPSKELVIFFAYTFLYELYNDHLVPHLDYMEKSSIEDIFNEINKYK